MGELLQTNSRKNLDTKWLQLVLFNNVAITEAETWSWTMRAGVTPVGHFGQLSEIAAVGKRSPPSQDHGNHHKIMAINTRSWQSSGHLVCDDHLCYWLLGRRRKIWNAQFIFLRRRRIWYIIYRNIYFFRKRRSLWLEHSRRKAKQARLQVRGDKVCNHD